MKIAITVITLIIFYAISVSATTTPQIIINEIMYDPAGSDSGHQWLEIINVSTSTSYVINDDWRFNDGSNHRLTVIQGDEVISPDEYIVITENDETFLQDYPEFQGSIIDTVMSLNNSDDVLSFSIDGGQSFFATTTYQSAMGGDDNGYSLERISFLNDWQESYILSGTPGEVNSLAPTNTLPIVEIIGSSTGLVNQLLEFTASSTDIDGDELNYFWSFGDQSTSSDKTVNHFFNQIGNYQVSVSVFDGWLSATDTLDIVIEEVEVQNEEVKNNDENYSNQIIINEVLPNPVGSDNEDEFIELYNRGNQKVNLEGWQLSDATDKKYVINIEDYPTTTISAFSYFVIFRKESGLALNNGGDKVELFQPDDNLLDEIEYTDSAGEGMSYSKSGGGFYFTIQITPGLKNIIKTAVENNHTCPAANIIYVTKDPSDEIDNQDEEVGDPDFNSDNYQGLRINEFMPNPAGSDNEEWVELYNNSTSTLELSGFSLDDEEGGSKPYLFKATSSIKAFEYLVINKAESKISLNNNEDTVRIINPLGEVFFEVAYTKAKDDMSYNFDEENLEWFWHASSTPSMKNVIQSEKNVEIAGQEILQNDIDNIPEEEFPLYSISAIKDLEKGTKVQAIGTVIVLPQILGTREIYMAEVDFIINSPVLSQGIQLYLSSAEYPILKIGDVIEVQGKVSEVQGEKRINLIKDGQINIIDNISIGQPELITIDDINDDVVGGLIYISGELVEQKGSNYYLDDGSGEIRMYLKKNTGIPKPEVEEGFFMDVTGILTLTKSGYRLLPRFDEDINVGQILGESEVIEMSDQEIIVEADDQRKNVMKYLIIGGIGIVVILLSLVIRYRYNKITNN